MGMHKRSDDIPLSEEVRYLNRINEALLDRKRADSGKFSGNLKDLDKDIPEQTKDYIYSIAVRDDNWVESFAVAKIDDINSYISIVYFPKDEVNKLNMISTICESKRPTKSVQKNSIRHKISDGYPLCPDGYTNIHSFGRS
jgi:Type IV pilin-like G and H, putative